MVLQGGGLAVLGKLSVSFCTCSTASGSLPDLKAPVVSSLVISQCILSIFAFNLGVFGAVSTFFLRQSEIRGSVPSRMISGKTAEHFLRPCRFSPHAEQSLNCLFDVDASRVTVPVVAHLFRIGAVSSSSDLPSRVSPKVAGNAVPFRPLSFCLRFSQSSLERSLNLSRSNLSCRGICSTCIGVESIIERSAEVSAK